MSATPTPHAHDAIPRFVLISAGLLVAFTIGASVFSQTSGVGRVALPASTAIQTLHLRFEDQADGGVAIRDADRGDVIHVVKPGVEGFIRATVRTLAQARKRDDFDGATPFNLTRWSDGTLSLDDPKTGRNIGLDAFGPTNVGAFAKLIQDREDIK